MKVTLKKTLVYKNIETYEAVVEVPDHLSNEDDESIMEYIKKDSDLEDLDWGDTIRVKEVLDDVVFEVECTEDPDS
jgi:hypothetical protein